MFMVKTNRKEELSFSYLNALCAYGSIDLTRITHDDDSRDAEIKKWVMRKDGTKIHSSLHIQLKSTSTELREDGEYISYPLKIKNYNDLIADSTTPVILALFVLPNDENEWLKHTICELVIKRCMYWISLSGNKPAGNDGNITIHIPKNQFVDCEALVNLLQKVAEEGQL